MIKTTTTNTTIATITPTLELLSSDCEAESVGELMKVLWTTAVLVASTAAVVVAVVVVVWALVTVDVLMAEIELVMVNVAIVLVSPTNTS